MPIYEFECVQCGRRFEELVSLKTDIATAVACPACGATGPRRRMSRFRPTGMGSKSAYDLPREYMCGDHDAGDADEGDHDFGDAGDGDDEDDE